MFHYVKERQTEFSKIETSASIQFSEIQTLNYMTAKNKYSNTRSQLTLKISNRKLSNK